MIASLTHNFPKSKNVGVIRVSRSKILNKFSGLEVVSNLVIFLNLVILLLSVMEEMVV